MWVSQWDCELKIAPRELHLGHFVRGMDVPWSEAPFPLQGVLIDTPEKKRWFEENCDWVVIDFQRSPNQFRPMHYSPARRESTDPGSAEAISILRRSPINQATLSRAIDGYQRLDQQADRLIDQIGKAESVDVQSAQTLVEGIASEMEEDIAALVWLTRIKQKDRYTAQHCVNVAILCMGLAVGLDWEAQRIKELGLAGLLHDLGKIQVNPKILQKPGRLTPEEYEEVKKHTVYGHDMLIEDGLVSTSIAEAVLHHHERPDGKGYPLGLTPKRTNPMAKIIGVVDAYDAITSRRPYDPARSHHQALGILWKCRGTQFDGKTVEALIAFMGWVTPGTLVRLSNGLIAVVLESPTQRGLRPHVGILAEEKGGWRLVRQIDLDADEFKTGANALRIQDVLPDGFGDIDMLKLSRQVAALRPTT